MNDFTKEELQILKVAMKEILFFTKTPQLMSKIQSMIDNYCDHESDNGLHTIVSFGSIVSNAICKCIKCSKYFLSDN